MYLKFINLTVLKNQNLSLIVLFQPTGKINEKNNAKKSSSTLLK